MDWYLPGTKAGGPVRSIHSLISLLKNDYEFLLVTGNTDLGELKEYVGILPNAWLHIDGIDQYFIKRTEISNKVLIDLVSSRKPDLIYLNSFWSKDFSIRLIHLKRTDKINCPVLLAPRGMLGKGAMGLKSGKKKLFLLISHITSLYKGIYFHATQVQEKKDVLKQFSAAKVFVAPNVNSGLEKKNVSQKKLGEVNLFYLSRIARVKNLHTALQYLAYVSPVYTVNYDIYGNAEDAEYVKECQKIIDELPRNINVRFCGELHFTKVQETLVNYEALFLPTLNENFGHSIVEALLCGCYAIISDQTPWNDLEQGQAGVALALSDRAGFVKAIENLAGMDQTAFLKQSLAANKYIRQKIDLPGIKSQYQLMFHGCI